MKVFYEGRLTDRRTPRSHIKQAPDKDADMVDFHLGGPEEFQQTQVLIHDLDKQFNGLRETLQHRRKRLAQLNRALSELRTLLFPSRGLWWRRWLPW